MSQIIERELTIDERTQIMLKTQELWRRAKEQKFSNKENKLETKRSYYSCMTSFIKTVPEFLDIFHLPQEIKNERTTQFLNYCKYVKGYSNNGVKTYKHILKFLGFYGTISKVPSQIERTKYALPIFTKDNVEHFLHICVRGSFGISKNIPQNILIIAYAILATARRKEEIKRIPKEDILKLVKGESIFVKILKGNIREEETRAITEYQLNTREPEFILHLPPSSPSYRLIQNEDIVERDGNTYLVPLQNIIHRIVLNIPENIYEQTMKQSFSHIVNPIFHYIVDQNSEVYKYGLHKGERSKSFGVGLYILKRYTISKLQEKAYHIIRSNNNIGGNENDIVRETVQNIVGHQSWSTTQRYLLPSSAVNVRNILTQRNNNNERQSETVAMNLLSSRMNLNQPYAEITHQRPLSPDDTNEFAIAEGREPSSPINDTDEEDFDPEFISQQLFLNAPSRQRVPPAREAIANDDEAFNLDEFVNDTYDRMMSPQNDTIDLDQLVNERYNQMITDSRLPLGDITNTNIGSLNIDNNLQPDITQEEARIDNRETDSVISSLIDNDLLSI